MNQLEYIYAVGSQNDRYFFNIDSPYPDECQDTCIVWNTIDYYGVPYDAPEGLFEELDSGQFDGAIKIGSISGCIILCKEIDRLGFDPVEICDDADQDLEYVLSAMSDKGAPFDAEESLEYEDVYYIHQFNMADGYNTPELKSAILEQLPNLVLKIYHIFPGYITFYPSPEEYEIDKNEIIRNKKLQQLSVRKIDAALGNSEVAENVIDFAQSYEFSDDELKEIMRRRVPGKSYPAEAKNKAEFNFYESIGFEEIGDSRLLCKAVEQE